MRDWGEWRARNYDAGLCITCGKPARVDRGGWSKVYCATHARKQAEFERTKRGVCRRYSCSICGESGHNRQSHDLYEAAS